MATKQDVQISLKRLQAYVLLLLLVEYDAGILIS